MHKTIAILAVAALAGIAAVGCGKSGSSGAGGGAENAEARSIYDSRCASCHGADGKGTGPAAAALKPKPQNYADAAWQKKVTDDELKTVIVKGGAGVGKSPLMPPNPDLESKPEVVTGLVAIVRNFGK